MSALCPIADSCGGCGLIHLPYAIQLERKRDRVAEVFARYVELEGVVVAPVRPAPRTTGYRTRAKLAAHFAEGRLQLGLFAPGTHVVTDVGDCPVLHPRLRALAAAIRALVSREAYVHLPLSYVSLRHSEYVARSHATLVLREDRRELAVAVAEALMREIGDLSGVALNLNPGPPLRVFGATFIPLVGEDALVERIADREFELSPGSFFQAHLDQADAIVRLAREALGLATGRLVDLYAGVGVLGLGLSQPEAELILVEGYDTAADDARRSAARNGFGTVRVVASPAERVAASLARELGQAERVVVNPPRKGCSAEVLRAVASLAPSRALYVSCDPETLARDLALLTHLGLRPIQVVPFDMLPLTDHVEVVAILAPVGLNGGGGWGIDLLHDDRDLAVVAKPGAVPIARLLTLLSADGETGWSPVELLDDGISGALLVAKNPEVARRLAKLREERGVASRHLCLVRGATSAAGRSPSFRRLATLQGHSLILITEALPTASLSPRLARAGHPIVGDELHGHRPTNRHFAEKYLVQRPMHHVAALGFAHPRGGAHLVVGAPLPGDFASVLERLGLGRGIDATTLVAGL